jgi:hypothetical protein
MVGWVKCTRYTSSLIFMSFAMGLFSKLKTRSVKMSRWFGTSSIHPLVASCRHFWISLASRLTLCITNYHDWLTTATWQSLLVMVLKSFRRTTVSHEAPVMKSHSHTREAVLRSVTPPSSERVLQGSHWKVTVSPRLASGQTSRVIPSADPSSSNVVSAEQRSALHVHHNYPATNHLLWSSPGL